MHRWCWKNSVHWSITFLASSSMAPVQWYIVNVMTEITFICNDYWSFVVSYYHLFRGVKECFVRNIISILMKSIFYTRSIAVGIVHILDQISCLLPSKSPTSSTNIHITVPMNRKIQNTAIATSWLKLVTTSSYNMYLCL